MGNHNKSRGKTQYHQKKAQHQGKTFQQRPTKFQEHRRKNPFSSGSAAHTVQNESKRDIVKNEVLEYLQKTTSKPWADVEKQKNDFKESEGNPFQKQKHLKWENFKDDKNLSSNDKHTVKRIMTKILTGYQPPLSLDAAMHTLQAKKKKEKLRIAAKTSGKAKNTKKNKSKKRLIK